MSKKADKVSKGVFPPAPQPTRIGLTRNKILHPLKTKVRFVLMTMMNRVDRLNFQLNEGIKINV